MDTGRLYGVDKKMNIAISDDFGRSWYSISKTLWRYASINYEMINATNIDDMLPTKLPGTDLTWRLANGTEWGGKVYYKITNYFEIRNRAP